MRTDEVAEAVDAAAESVRAVSKVRDDLDPELLQVFLTEAAELLPAVATGLRGLASNPNDRELARDLMRKLHTIKGSARMAGAMRLGELVHAMETRMEAAMQRASVTPETVDALHTVYDRAMALYDELHDPNARARAPGKPDEADAAEEPPRAPVIDLASARELTHGTRVESKPELADRAPAAEQGRRRPWPLPTEVSATLPTAAPSASQSTFIRVRADVLDKLVDQAGEVAIARSKLENEVGTIKSSLGGPDREHPAPAVAAARSGDPGRRAAAGARRPAVARVGGLRSARVRPLHAPAGTDADARGVGRGRGDGPEQHAQGPAVGRRRPHRRSRA